MIRRCSAAASFLLLSACADMPTEPAAPSHLESPALSVVGLNADQQFNHGIPILNCILTSCSSQSGQTFVPTATNVAAVRLFFSNLTSVSASADVTVTLRSRGMSGSVLGSATSPVSMNANGNGNPFDFNFSGPVQVTPGLTYAIEVQGSSNTIAIMGARVGSNGLTVANMYPQGQAVTNGVPAGDTEDYYFATYADPSFNARPAVAADAASVSADEGQTATNTGTVSDPDLNVVSLSATVGTVVNNNDGTWSWNFATVDGPAESQTVTISANDGNGGSASTSFQLTVENVDPTIAFIAVPLGPVALSNQPVNIVASFSDPAGAADQMYECTVDLGNGLRPQPGTVAGNACSVPGLTYVEPGIYTITFFLLDKDGGSDSRTSEQYVVIYDPNGSFVTGGGWIDSPAGAYRPDISITGNATFGFVSKYLKGKTTPAGTTQFQFHAAGMDFESATYEWLVVSQGGTAAQFKGAGTVNGALGPNGQAYKFMLWAGDGAPDRLRIRIWTENAGTETVVYDNGFDQPLGGGSIVVHTKGK